MGTQDTESGTETEPKEKEFDVRDTEWYKQHFKRDTPSGKMTVAIRAAQRAGVTIAPLPEEPKEK